MAGGCLLLLLQRGTENGVLCLPLQEVRLMGTPPRAGICVDSKS